MITVLCDHQQIATRHKGDVVGLGHHLAGAIFRAGAALAAGEDAVHADRHHVAVDSGTGRIRHAAADVEGIDAAAVVGRKTDVVAGGRVVVLAVFRVARVVQHAAGDLADGKEGAAAHRVVGETFHLAELVGGSHDSRIAATLEAGSQHVHAFPDGQALDIIVSGRDRRETVWAGIVGRRFGRVEHAREDRAFGNGGADPGIRGVAQVDPAEAGGAGAFRAGLLPDRGIEDTAGQVARRVRNKHEQDVVGAIVGEIDRLAVRHDVAELMGKPAQRETLPVARLAAGDAHLGDPAVIVRVGTHRTLQVVLPVPGHRGGVVIVVVTDRTCFLDTPRVGLVLLAAEVGLPRRHGTGAMDPAAELARLVDEFQGSRNGRELTAVVL